MESQTGSPVRNQDLKRFNIYEQSVEGLKETVTKVLSDYNETPIPSALVPSTWSQRDLQIAFGEVTYPYIAISPGPIRKNYGVSYNPMLAMHYSKNVRLDDETVCRLMLMPVEADFRIQLVSQDLNTCQKVLESYLFRYKSMRFILKASKLEIGITLKLDNDSPAPEQAMEESGNIFRMDFNITMSSYIGEIEVVRSIKQDVLTVNTVSRGNTVSRSN